MKKVILYSDGACSYNPGPGGWGCVLIYKNIQKEMSGFCDNTTNNRMELTAIIKGLEALKNPYQITKESYPILHCYLPSQVDIIEKELKALEIIKRKRVDVVLFLTILEFHDDKTALTLYNREILKKYCDLYVLTQEEYDLLKEELL